MNKKNLIILLIIFAILIGLVVVKESIKPEIPTREEVTDIVAQRIDIADFSDILLRISGWNN